MFWTGLISKLIGWRKIIIGGVLVGSIGLVAYWGRSAIVDWQETIVESTLAKQEVVLQKSLVETLQKERIKQEALLQVMDTLWQEQLAANAASEKDSEIREIIIYRDYGDSNESKCIDTTVPEPIVDSLLNYAKARNRSHN